MYLVSLLAQSALELLFKLTSVLEHEWTSRANNPTGQTHSKKISLYYDYKTTKALEAGKSSRMDC